MRYLISGATGFIGTHLTNFLRAAGDNVEVISRRPNVGVGWERDKLLAALSESDVLVHLAGAGVIDKPWSEARRKELLDSRVQTTGQLAELCNESGGIRFVCASAVGIYGPRDRSEALDEQSSHGADFLAGLCQSWEEAAGAAQAGGTPTAIVRIGVVLGQDGGALKKMLLPFKLGLGGPLGDGRQPFPWIHIEDLVRLIQFLAENRQHTGPFNGVAPGGCSQREFARELGRALRRPAFLPTPALAMRALLGERATLLLTGQNAVPCAAIEAGFEFRFPELQGALSDLLGRSR